MIYKNNIWHTVLISKKNRDKFLSELILEKINGEIQEYYYYKNSRSLLKNLTEKIIKIFAD